jgi:hypothetical protein
MMALSRWLKGLFLEFSAPQTCDVESTNPPLIQKRLNRYTSS